MAQEQKKGQPSGPDKGPAEEENKPSAAKAAEGSENQPSAGKPSDRSAKGSQTRKPKPESKTRARRQPAKKAEPKPVEAEVEAAAERPESAAKPPSRRRAPRPASGERSIPTRPLVRAQARYVRSSSRKARLVVDHIRGKSVGEARAILNHAPRAVARDLEKLLASAVANAENNHELVGDDLYVKEVFANEGPTLKRFRPRALGRATRIRKRTTHLTLTLTPRE